MPDRHIGHRGDTPGARRAVASAILSAPRVTTTHRLVTDAWTSDVKVLEAAVDRFNDEPLVADDCHVAFFEIAFDEQLHVNVTHRHPTRTAPGWIGPGAVAGGFVYNRRFSNATPGRIARHIHDMVFAAPR